jgi:hypothetical protein
MKQESFPVEQFPTEGSLWKLLENAISRLNKGDSKTVLMASTIVGLNPRLQSRGA